MKNPLFLCIAFGVILITSCTMESKANDESVDSEIATMENNCLAIEDYFKTHDSKYLAYDAEFIHVGTGEVTKGKEAIEGMLNHIYHVAFDAHAEVLNTIITDDKALLEANFKGKHIGEFAGIPATGKMVNVPLVVSYDLENGKIQKARVYMLTSVMMKQLNDEKSM